MSRANVVGTVRTKILVSVAGDTPTEIATLEHDVTARAGRDHHALVRSGNRWRWSLAIGLLRCAWAALTATPERTPLPYSASIVD